MCPNLAALGKCLEFLVPALPTFIINKVQINRNLFAEICHEFRNTNLNTVFINTSIWTRRFAEHEKLFEEEYTSETFLPAVENEKFLLPQQHALLLKIHLIKKDEVKINVQCDQRYS